MRADVIQRLHRLAPIAVLSVISGFLPGCQGPLTRGNAVRVEAHPNSDDLSIDPPKQRLSQGGAVDEVVRRTTVKRPRSMERIDDRAQQPDSRRTVASHDRPGSSEVDSRAEASRMVKKSKPTSHSPSEVRRSAGSPEHGSDAIELTFGDSDIDRIASDLMRRAGVAEDREPSDASPPPSREELARHLKTLPSKQRSEIVAGFKSASPAKQRLALDRLVALARQNARPSSQPASIDALLENALDDLPALHDAPASAYNDQVYPTRLAADETIAQMQQRLESARRSARWARETVEQDIRVGGPVPGDPDANESAIRQVAAVEDSHVMRRSDPRGSVRTVTHTGPMHSGQHSADSAAVESAVAQVSAALLSDEALFRMLLQRTRKPIAGESQSESQRRQIIARHLMVLSGDPDSAVEPVEGLTEKEKEYLRHQLLALWTIIDPDGHPVPGRRFSAALPHLRKASRYLAAATDTLDVRSLAFCTEVESFGQIQEFESNTFEAGQEVILYYEVDNFTVEKREDGFETHLQGSYDIYDASNRKVVSQLLPADKQLSRNYLRDYFIAYQMYLPKELPAGDYQLKLTMEDVSGKKYGQTNLNFTIKPE